MHYSSHKDIVKNCVLTSQLFSELCLVIFLSVHAGVSIFEHTNSSTALHYGVKGGRISHALVVESIGGCSCFVCVTVGWFDASLVSSCSVLPLNPTTNRHVSTAAA